MGVHPCGHRLMAAIHDFDWDAFTANYGPEVGSLRDRLIDADVRVVDPTESDIPTEAIQELVAASILERRVKWICPSGHVFFEPMEPGETDCPAQGEDLEGTEPEKVVELVSTLPTPGVPVAVLTAHGMNTFGKWQEDLAARISLTYRTPVPLMVHKYGRVVAGVILPWRHNKLRDRLVLQIKGASASLERQPAGSAPDVIAHSFGTWLLYQALVHDEDLTVGQVILCGCIVPPNVDWSQFDGRVGAVLNHYGGKDLWARLAMYVIPRSGPAGLRGFNEQADVVQVFEPTFSHSQYFAEAERRRVFEEVWEPFLAARGRLENLDGRVFLAEPRSGQEWKTPPAFLHARLVKWLLWFSLIPLAFALVVAVVFVTGLGLAALAIPVVVGFLAMLAGTWRGWDR